MSFIDRLQALAGQGEILHRDPKATTGHPDVVYDTRKMSGDASQSIFAALKGSKRDGHDFIGEAHRKGIRHFLISDPDRAILPGNYLLVDDVLLAMQAMARNWRQQAYFPRVIGITGSNGKTIVKDWLGILFAEVGPSTYQSPRSYNSQLGVALSLLNYRERFAAEQFLLEVGISRPGEMERLEAMAQPEIGIMTHFGDAHDEGFDSRKQKLDEKLKLFQSCEKVYVSSDQVEVVEAMRELDLPFVSVGWAASAALQLHAAQETVNGWQIHVTWKGETWQMHIPVPGDAALENALLCLLVVLDRGVSPDIAQKALDRLLPVEMRMEMITDNPEIAVINDTWNSDRISIGNAFALLGSSQAHPRKIVVLSDLEQQGQRQEEIQKEVLQVAIQSFGQEGVILVGECFSRIAEGQSYLEVYPDVEALIESFDYGRFRHSTVLLKGARRYRLERLIPYLSQRAVASSFQISMDALRHNYRFFRQHVPASAKIMVMVKANAYGSGSWEIAEAVAKEGADYFAVAYTSEGINLRNRGISLPIMVLNADLHTLDQVLRHGLEPEVGRWALLEDCLRGAQDHMQVLRIHIKVDTGMSRLGFAADEGKAVGRFLEQHKDHLQVASVLSHLAAADEAAKDDFTRQQLSLFEQFYEDLLSEYTGEPPLRHILNTAGILRFPEHSYDMVRVGIGLYGVSPVEQYAGDLQEIGTLRSLVSQIHEYPRGTAIGYGCTDITQRASRIGVVPVGYGDGVRRALSNGKFAFLVRGKRAPVIGRVCMDMLMLDLTDVPGATEGDEVILIGKQGQERISVNEMAAACDTIAYEILTGIGQRVRRVYVSE